MKNAKFVEALKYAKNRLWNGRGKRFSGRQGTLKQYYICNALAHATHSSYALRRLIHQRLGDSITVEDWLEGIGVPLDQLNDKNLQEYRHRWIDELIKEFS